MLFPTHAVTHHTKKNIVDHEKPDASKFNKKSNPTDNTFIVLRRVSAHYKWKDQKGDGRMLHG